MTGHIVPMGAGLAVMQRRDDPLHDYVLELTGKDDPVVLFLGTPTGDDNSYIVIFYEAFHSGRCRPRHLRLFHRDYDDLTDIVLGSDVIHVGGGNTANMLDVWHRQGVDVLLHEALERGAGLTGGSAGGLCWFEGGTTDSFGPTLALLHEGLGRSRPATARTTTQRTNAAHSSTRPCSTARSRWATHPGTGSPSASPQPESSSRRSPPRTEGAR